MGALAVRVRRLEHGRGLAVPTRASSGSSGYDLRAAVADALELAPGERSLVPTGWAFEIPEGWEGQVRPRSGLALSSGITVANSPGTIDSDYRGEISVLLVNLGSETVVLRRGDRIAQLVFCQVGVAAIEVAEELSDSLRGSGGFGSTGL